MRETDVEAKAACSVQVWVHRLRIHGPADEEVERTTVLCPLEEAFVDSSECGRCGQLVESTEDALGRLTSMRCELRELPEPVGLPPDAPGRTPVAQMMRREVVAVRPDLGGQDLVRVLVEQGVAGAPVVEASGRPIGVVSIADVVRELYEEAEEPSVSLGPVSLGELEAAELMTSPALCLRLGTSVAEAAAVMASEGIHRMPVVAEDGTVVGVVGSLDILRWMAQESGYVSLPDRPRRRG